MSTNDNMKILVVCFGNICRSPMAEGLLKKHLSDEKFKVSSAGIGALEGNEASRSAILSMKIFNIDIENHRARYLTKEILKEADLILVMEDKQKDYIISFYPQAEEKTELLTRFAAGDDSDIDDPIGQSADYYQKTAQILDSYLKKAAEKIRGKC